MQAGSKHTEGRIPPSTKLADTLNRAIAFHQTGRLTQAQTLYEEILRIEPRHFDALHLLGALAGQTNNSHRALDLIGKALDIHPDSFVAHCNRGSALKQLGRFDEAIVSFDQSIALNPDYADAHFNKGIVLRELGRLEDALSSYDRAIAIKPDFAPAHYSRANVLCDLKQPAKALDGYDRAISISGGYAEAYSGRGNALKALGQFDAALASYGRAIALKPHFAEGYLNRAHLLLLTGNFEQGWIDYEWRWKTESGSSVGERRAFAQPLWLGKDALDGKSILLWGEQGFGDAIQFCRYAPRVAALGAKVIMEVRKPLLGLLGQLNGVSQCVERGNPLPHFDFHCPLLSLPLAFGTHLNTIPAEARYLASDPARVAWWTARLGEQTKPRVGLAWSGNKRYKQDHYRRISLAELIPYLPTCCQYISLQKEVRDGDRTTLRDNPDILDFSDELGDFANTAALCECLDLVISVDTSIAHLSAALGKRTWILLSSNPDWRWLLDRADSPWYPSARLYRQNRGGHWTDVLQRINVDLMHEIQKGGV